jgi:RNA polymerase sigma-70 factor, ECF subfamily
MASAAKVYDSPEELRLVHKAKTGDEGAFRKLYDAHHKRVFVTVKRVLSDEDLSLWIANIALAKVWKGLPRFKEQSKFSTWVTRIAINEARMHIRAQKRHANDVSLDSILSGGTNTASAHDAPVHKWLATKDLNLAGIADRQVLERAIVKVPEQFHEILRLRFWEGMSMEEIQEKISVGEPKPVSISAVKSRILRGKTILMEQVEKIS